MPEGLVDFIEQYRRQSLKEIADLLFALRTAGIRNQGLTNYALKVAYIKENSISATTDTAIVIYEAFGRNCRRRRNSL